MKLEHTAVTEAEAARTANNDDKEVVMEDEESSEIEEGLVDYNEQEETEATMKAAELVALKEMLTANGHTLREILRSEKVKAHYNSPFSEEDAMSIKDILREIPRKTYMK